MSDPASYSKPGTQGGIYGDSSYENILVTEDLPLPVKDVITQAVVSAIEQHARTIQEEILQNILGELKVISWHLAQLSDDHTATPRDLHGDEL